MSGLRGMAGWAAAGALLTAAAHGDTPPCDARPALHAVPVAGEAFGTHNFVEPAGDGLNLGLRRAQWGWRIAVLDDQGQDLMPASTMRGGLPEQRDLYGWHFRSADNAGPNTGEVNAPQHLRTFAFMHPAAAAAPTGLGWLHIDDMALSGLEPGGRARIDYLRYSACLMWPKTDQEIAAEANARSLDFLPEEEEMMRACGLDGAYALDARFAPRLLSGDFDGDDAHDYAAFVRRTSDGARGVAICRAGAWLDILGLDGPVPGSPMDDQYAAMTEAWRVSTMDEVMTGWDGEAPRPHAVGDVLVLERIEKALYSLYWDGARFRSHQHYRYVEP